MLQIESEWFAYGVIVIPIALVHLWLPAFSRRFASSEDAWMGFAGGVALGYVMLYMLPKLSAMTLLSRDLHPDSHLFVHLRAYLVLLAGIVLYLIIDRLDQSPRYRDKKTARMMDYGIHGIYHLLAGYIAIELPAPGLVTHILISVILVLHVMGMSNMLRHKRPEGYLIARWFLFVLVLLGGLMGLLTELPKPLINVTTAFLCGIIILNVISEERPNGKEGKLAWFLLGVGAFLVTMFTIVNLMGDSLPLLKTPD
jgi:hypothetical protein